jgi:OmcA/MtrC family decaheme c-type cytochrome
MAGAGKSPYGPHDKAAFATQATIDFLRPGMVVTINSASVAADGTITTTYTLTDPAGLPLDAAGVYTPGPITMSYVAAYIPATQDQYTAYTTRVQTGAAGSFTNAGTDTGGVTTALGNGQYTYVFGTKAPKGFDASATTSVGVFGRRTMTAFNVPNNMASAVFTFVPNGNHVTKVRDIVRTSSCNGCHDQLSHHSGQRRQVDLCILCHQPQSFETVGGGTVDFKVIMHKIHMGSQLPSVIAGGKFQVQGTDYSTVVFPADPRRCEKCHDQKSGAVQATNYLTKPSRAVCGSCHDDVNFATGANHPGGPQISDNQCATCHMPQGELEFDASIKGAHTIPMDSTTLGGVQITLTSITNGGAGQKPVVAFTMKDGSGAVLPLSKLTSLSFTMAGPTSDYGYTSFGSDVTTKGYVTENALATSSCGSNGACLYNFTHAVPANAKGTYAIGMEARRTEILLPGTTKQQSVNYSPQNKVLYFSVDGSAVVNRRLVVAISNCNGCHVELNHHGGRRNDTLYCVLCHNPSNTDASTPVPQGVNFNLLIHRIHTGRNLVALGKSYTVSGTDFTTIRYSAMDPTGVPGDTRNCSLCHLANTEQNLPLGKNPVVDPQGPVNPDLPITAACTACHADMPSVGHALVNTSSVTGETCTVCHKSGAEFSVASQHAQY